MNPFAYPSRRCGRRHGPAGYENYESYREWLRDEFNFACVYTLFRERWVGRDCFQIDHLVPQKKASMLECEYTNLIYSYHLTNRLKSATRIPDPCSLVLSECLEVHDDGEISSLSKEGEALIGDLRLKHPILTEKRREWINILTVLEEHDPSQFNELMGPPTGLIDLGRLRPPKGNSRAEGIAESMYARIHPEGNQSSSPKRRS